MPDQITIRGARLHNLKNITLAIPKNQLVVLTGVSGSGKSTLGFDILHKEGQRQYLESLGLRHLRAGQAAGRCHQRAVAHRSASTSTSPTTARAPRWAPPPRSTPTCGCCSPAWAPPLPDLRERRSTLLDAAEAAWEDESGGADDAAPMRTTLPLPALRRAASRSWAWPISRSTSPPGPARPAPGWAASTRRTSKRLVDEAQEPRRRARCWAGKASTSATTRQILQAAGRHYGFHFDLSLPVKDYTPSAARPAASTAWKAPTSAATSRGIEPPATVRQGRFEGVATNLLRRYAEHIHAIHEADYREKLDEFLVTQTCPDCDGTRLRPESRPVTVNGQTIIDLSRLPLDGAGRLAGRPARGLSARTKMLIAEPDPGRPERAHRAAWWRSAPAT